MGALNRMLNWLTSHDALKVKVSVCLLGGLALAGLTSFFRSGSLEAEPSVEIVVKSGKAISGADSDPGIPYSVELPEKNRHRVSIQLQLSRGGNEALATIILLKTSGGATAHEVKLAKDKWVSWSAEGEYQRVIVEVRPTQTRPGEPPEKSPAVPANKLEADVRLSVH